MWRRVRLSATLALEPDAMPQDVRSAPDGTLFYVADMMANGVYVIDPYDVRVEPRRGERVGDRPRERQPIAKWEIPGGGSPDMGGLSIDGSVLWLSGRYNQEVYAFDTKDGHLLARIKVGRGAHGLAVLSTTRAILAETPPNQRYAGERRVVDQNCASWNRARRWLTQMQALRSAA
jgi:DNA-binding beta-propeller fold protein YncE